MKPRHPWPEGKAERLQSNPAVRLGRAIFCFQSRGSEAMRPWLGCYNNHRPHGSLGGSSPISRCNASSG
ncbi:hypothetical protein HWD94_12740 [Pseudarthrobacter equi]|nr:hypothetical protein [Pseudarthrobacter equi]NUT72165.1 hypothetical protein [Pseudarthrobacter sp. C4D7]